MFPLSASIRALGNKALWTGTGAAASDDCCCYGPPPPPPDPPTCDACSTGVRRWKLVVSGIVSDDPPTEVYCPWCPDRNGIFFLDNYECEAFVPAYNADYDGGTGEFDPSDTYECNWFWISDNITEFCGYVAGAVPHNIKDDNPNADWWWGWRLKVSAGLFGSTSVNVQHLIYTAVDDADEIPPSSHTPTINERTNKKYHACMLGSDTGPARHSAFANITITGSPADCAALSISLPLVSAGYDCDYSGAAATAEAIL